MNPEITPATGWLRRTNSPAKLPALVAITILLLMVTGKSVAMEIAEWRFQTSLYTKHWSPDPEHVNDQKLLNIEFETTTRWIYGFAHFDNSFGQPSQYLYAGYSWPLFGTDWSYFKLTGGILHGYKEPYEDKIPLNDLGFAPAIIPTIGLRYKRVFTELQIAGTAAITVTAGFSFGRKAD